MSVDGADYLSYDARRSLCGIDRKIEGVRYTAFQCGIYLGMFQVAHISGNLISSLVLKFGATDASATNRSVNATGFECDQRNRS